MNKNFFEETFAKNLHNSRLAETMLLAMKAGEWLPEAEFIRTEQGRHHQFNFNVYSAQIAETRIECKTKITSGEILYNMRIIKNED